MSKLQNIKIHNKNVLDSIEIITDDVHKNSRPSYGHHKIASFEELKERKVFKPLYSRMKSYDVDDLKQDFCYVDTLSEFFHLKRALISFYNKLTSYYNNSIASANINLRTLNEEKAMIEKAPILIKEIEKRIDELKTFVDSKDENYETSVELYKQKEKYTDDLNAKISYQEQVTETKHVLETYSEPQLIYDIVLHMPRTVYHSRTRYVSKPVTKTVTKYRPDTKKIEEAKASLVELEKLIEKVPTYEHNVEVYKSYKLIDGLKDEIQHIYDDIDKTKDLQSQLINQINSDLNVAKKLKDILKSEKNIITSTIKDSTKYSLKDIEDLPEQQM